MQLIKNTIKLDKYLDIDIIDKSFDDIENDATVEIDVTFSMRLSGRGIVMEIYNIDAVRWSYTGIKFAGDENQEHQVTGSSDESWTINTQKSKSDDDNFGLFLNDVIIDLEKKTIGLDFEC
jgi:hypothetical protein